MYPWPSIEYWQPKKIFSITRGIDTPLSLDKSCGFFSHVLVYIDLLFDLPNQILMERLGFSFITNVPFFLF